MSLNYTSESNGVFSSQNSKTIFEGVVKKIDDPNNTGRIKVFVDGVDNGLLIENLPYAYPLLGINNKVPLNVGETVRIIFKDINRANKSDNNRLWVGPILSSEKYLESQATQNPTLNDSDFYKIGLNDVITPDKSTKISGRKNSELILGDNNVKIIAGKYKKNKELNETPAFYESDYSSGTSINKVVADEIFLLSNQNQPNSNNTIDDIRVGTHPMVYGDKLIEIIKLQNEIIINHIHSHPQKEPVKDTNIKKLIELTNNIESLLSKSIKIN